MITLEPPRGLPAGVEPWRAVDLSRGGLTRFLRAAQQLVGFEGGVDVLLADDGMLRKLNREFRGKDKATDVLSFPAADFPAADFAEARGVGTRHAGDLAISLETAARQAAEQGHSLRDEVRVLLLHGLLHLYGMDHETDGGEMAKREAELRVRLRLPSGLIARVEGEGKSRVSLGVTTKKPKAKEESQGKRGGR